MIFPVLNIVSCIYWINKAIFPCLFFLSPFVWINNDFFAYLFMHIRHSEAFCWKTANPFVNMLCFPFLCFLVIFVIFYYIKVWNFTQLYLFWLLYILLLFQALENIVGINILYPVLYFWKIVNTSVRFKLLCQRV